MLRVTALFVFALLWRSEAVLCSAYNANLLTISGTTSARPSDVFQFPKRCSLLTLPPGDNPGAASCNLGANLYANATVAASCPAGWQRAPASGFTFYNDLTSAYLPSGDVCMCTNDGQCAPGHQCLAAVNNFAGTCEIVPSGNPAPLFTQLCMCNVNNAASCGGNRARGTCVAYASDRYQYSQRFPSSSNPQQYGCLNYRPGTFCQCEGSKFLTGSTCSINSCNIEQCGKNSIPHGRCLGNVVPNIENIPASLWVTDDKVPSWLGYYIDSPSSIVSRSDFYACECDNGWGPELSDSNMSPIASCTQPVACKKGHTRSNNALAFNDQGTNFDDANNQWQCQCALPYAGAYCTQDCNTALCSSRSRTGQCSLTLRGAQTWNSCECQDGWGPSQLQFTSNNVPIYYDNNISQPVTFCYARTNSAGQECNGHGTWLPRYDPNGACHCTDPLYPFDPISQTCVQKCPPWTTYPDLYGNVPNARICGGIERGTCALVSATSLDTRCVCNNGFTGLACETALCPLFNGAMCGGNGYCDTFARQCVCNSMPVRGGAFVGHACEIYITDTLRQCGGAAQPMRSMPAAYLYTVTDV